MESVRQSFPGFVQLSWRRGFAWNSGARIACAAHFGNVVAGTCELFPCRGTQVTATDGVWMSGWLASPQAVTELHDRTVDLQFDVSMPPTDEPWGVLGFHLRHPDGHMFRVSAGLADLHGSA